MERAVALAMIAITFPVILGVLKSAPQYRSTVIGLLGFSLLIGGAVRIDAVIYGWDLWQGNIRGYGVSPREMACLALILSRPPVPKRLSFWPLIIAFISVQIFSIFSAFQPLPSTFMVWQTGRMILLFAALGGELANPRMRQALLTGFACGLMLQAGYVLQQKASGVVQAAGTIGHQNALGMMVELTLIPLVASLLAGDRRKLTYAGVFAGMVVIAAGGSRATMAFCVGGIFILFILSLARGSTPRKRSVIGAAVVAVLVFAPVGYMTLNQRFKGGPMIALDLEREALKRAAVAMAADHPFGVGVNNYVAVANIQGYSTKAGVQPTVQNRAVPVHNGYLLARAETGWIGELALIALLFVPMVVALRFAFRYRQGSSPEIVLGSGVALLLNVVHNNWEFGVLTYGMQVLIFVNLALIAAEVRAASLSAMPRRRSAPLADRVRDGASAIRPVSHA